MGKRTLGLAAFLVSATALMPRAEAAETVVQLHLECVITPAMNLGRAQAEVDRIFRVAGVRIAWTAEPVSPLVSVNQSACEPRHLTLILVNAHRSASKIESSASDEVLGLAAVAASRAYVYVDNIVVATNSRNVDRGTVLGRVMAHELGHLLLPPNSHSKFGIMRSGADFAMAGVHVFTDRQADSIRATLARACQ